MTVMKKGELKRHLKKLWYFIWEDDSLLSWIINVILAFILIKFLIYPGLGLMLGTDYPIVAVISSSMEHDGNFDDWWDSRSIWYEEHNITKEGFEGYSFKNGFNKGDIMVLYGKEPENIKIGEVLVFQTTFRPDPIIHRVVGIKHDSNYDRYYFTTKGDHNANSYPFETNVPEDNILGKAVFRIPWLGYIKIGFVKLLQLLHIM